MVVARGWKEGGMGVIVFCVCVCVCVCVCFCCAMQHTGSWFPNWGSNLSPLHWERRVYTTGLPGTA